MTLFYDMTHDRVLVNIDITAMVSTEYLCLLNLKIIFYHTV